jgi:cell division transport system ATP-binding protein
MTPKKKKPTTATKAEKKDKPLIRFEGVSKRFPGGTLALDQVSFAAAKGEFLFVVGRSGAGKTTLLRLLRRELPLTDGEIYFKDWEVSRLPGTKIPLLRRRIAIIFQDYKLLLERTVWENTAVALDIIGYPKKKREKKIETVLRQVGIWDRRRFYPLQLSGGEAQRTAIARALVVEPDIILADEPTGDLDPGTTWEIIDLLKKINSGGTTVIVATHDFDVVDSLEKRVITLDQGRVVSDKDKAKYFSEN